MKFAFPLGVALEFAVGATLTQLYGLGSVVLAVLGVAGVKLISMSGQKEKS